MACRCVRLVQLLLVCARPVGPCAAVELHEHVERLREEVDEVSSWAELRLITLRRLPRC